MPLPLRVWINRLRRKLWRLLFSRMLFGERAQDGKPLPLTRMSPSTCFEHPEGLSLADNVFIGHFNLIEARQGVRIDTGTQITNYVSIVTHSSHRSLRLMGPDYAAGSRVEDEPGLVCGPVHIGAYCFIGPHTVIEANTTLGKGCQVASHSRVRGRFPDFSVIAGSPAQRVGDTRDGDAALLDQHPQWRARYEAWAGADEPRRPRRSPSTP